MLRPVDRVGERARFGVRADENVVRLAKAVVAVADFDLDGKVLAERGEHRLDPELLKLGFVQRRRVGSRPQVAQRRQRVAAVGEQALVPVRQVRDDFVQVVIGEQAVVQVGRACSQVRCRVVHSMVS